MPVRDFIRFIRNGLIEFLHRRDLQYLFLLAFVLRLSYMMLMFGQLDAGQILSLSSDTDEYVTAARAFSDFQFSPHRAVWIFGPGYSLFLGLIFFLCGAHPIPVMLVQGILSSAICLMLYRLGHELSGSKAVGYIAGILSAVSFTSISLANFLLSDTLFFFLFLWGNLAFVLGMKNHRRSYFVFSGVCIGVAALVRSVGQFWPLVLPAFIFLLPMVRPFGWRRHGRLHLFKQAWPAPLIAILIISGWMTRNYAVYSVPTVAYAGSHGLGKLAAATEAKMNRGTLLEALVERAEQYKRELGKDEFTEREQYVLRMEHFREVLAEHPGEMLSMYIDLVDENALAVNELYRIQIPRFKEPILRIMTTYREWDFHYGVLVLCGLGLATLVLRRQWLPLIYLGGFLLYMLSMVGFVMWQGSRPFFPAQMSWTILAAAALAEISRAIGNLVSRLTHH